MDTTGRTWTLGLLALGTVLAARAADPLDADRRVAWLAAVTDGVYSDAANWTGGELPALLLTDAIARMCDGVLAEQAGYEKESHFDGLLEYPQFTRPEAWRGRTVPEVLRGGNHRLIEGWRAEQSLERTRRLRPDLYERYVRLHPPKKRK